MHRFLAMLIVSGLFLCPSAQVLAASGQGKLTSTDLFKKTSPGVVLLIGQDSIGTGTILNKTEILTNWHVVESNDRILVAFKPKEEGASLDPDEFVVGDVVRVDTNRDLAIVRVKRIPSHAGVILMGTQDEVQIGADVHAIGHPQGEIWTYTKGVISQVRKDFEWRVSPVKAFKADVIQTQTPINPGNSGGPLLSDRGQIIGINSFKSQRSEGLNFAVALSELTHFIGKGYSKNNAPEPRKKSGKIEPDLLYQGRDKDDTGYMREFDESGKGEVTHIYFYPDDTKLPFYCFVEGGKGTLAAVVMDMDRDGKWDYSVHDKDGNGKFESIGLHPKGTREPSSFISYTSKKAPASVREMLPRQVPVAGPDFIPSPSFDCARADTLVDRTICSDEILADMDVTVAALNSRVQEKRKTQKAQLEAGQKEWLQGNQNQCGGEDVVDCLDARYKQRIIYLNVLMLQ